MILNLIPPNTMKEMKSFLESVNHLRNFILILEKLCHPLRALLK